MYEVIVERMRHLQKQIDVAYYYFRFGKGSEQCESKYDSARELFDDAGVQLIQLFDVIRRHPESLERFIKEFDVKVETRKQHYSWERLNRLSMTSKAKKALERFYTYTWVNRGYGPGTATLHTTENLVFLSMTPDWVMDGKKIILKETIKDDYNTDKYSIPFHMSVSIETKIRKPWKSKEIQ